MHVILEATQGNHHDVLRPLCRGLQLLQLRVGELTIVRRLNQQLQLFDRLVGLLELLARLCVDFLTLDKLVGALYRALDAAVRRLHGRQALGELREIACALQVALLLHHRVRCLCKLCARRRQRLLGGLKSSLYGVDRDLLDLAAYEKARHPFERFQLGFRRVDVLREFVNRGTGFPVHGAFGIDRQTFVHWLQALIELVEGLLGLRRGLLVCEIL
mmetsp:Transcript_102685/g.290198  ORF Transcript_102685/g.290198 Transcript_102685/m.290198 type:complete len:216 (+) Transcript_102685:3363-4010(+)